jgi:hypothetical protein
LAGAPITSHFFESGFRFAEGGQRTHLLDSVGFADLAHREANMYEHPLSWLDARRTEQTELDAPADPRDVDYAKRRIALDDLNDLSGNGETHAACSSLR